MISPRRSAARSAAILITFSIALAETCATAYAAAPPIRTSAANRVPTCATPARLDAFLVKQIRARGYRLHPAFRNIARHYRRHGKRYHVRWDYAFFQMALETNFLSFRRGDGKRSDVRRRQNNFAGLGTTGGGVRGDSYPDVSTGVIAQIQHLVVYSGSRLKNPVGHRTRKKQDVILQSVKKIVRRRPVTFADLARRWAADRHYGRSIERLATLFYASHCNKARKPSRPTSQNRPVFRPTRLIATTRTTKQRVAARHPVITTPPPDQHKLPPRPQKFVRSPSPALSKTARSRKMARAKPLLLKASSPKLQLEKPSTLPAISCKVQTASFGGKRTVLIENTSAGTIKLTALSVHPGFEVAMATNFIQSYAPNGRTIGAYDSRGQAIARAHEICRQRIAAAK